jgi:hypothetical protein
MYKLCEVDEYTTFENVVNIFNNEIKKFREDKNNLWKSQQKFIEERQSFNFMKEDVYNKLISKIDFEIYSLSCLLNYGNESNNFISDVINVFKELRVYILLNKNTTKKQFIKNMKEEIFGGNFHKYRYFRKNGKAIKRHKRFKNFQKL